MRLRDLFTHRPAPLRTIDIAFDGMTFPVRLRRHRHARRYTLRIVSATRDVVLTLPSRGSLSEAKAFAQQHGGWIAARLSSLPHAEPFAPGQIIPLRDTPHRIEHRPAARGVVWTEINDCGEHLLCVAGEAAHIGRRVADYLKREARRDLETASRRYAQMLDVKVKRITLRDTTSRWGSCSSLGTLSFSWRLIFAPPYVLDYLAAHEVAHLVEMNDSIRFWRLVARMTPDAARAKTWLDSRGGDLHRYGLSADDPAMPEAKV